MQLHWQPVFCMCDISYRMRGWGAAQARKQKAGSAQSTGSTNQHNKTHLEGGTTKNDPNNNSTWCDSLARAISLVVCRPASQPASQQRRSTHTHTHSVMLLLLDTPMPHTCTCSPTRQPHSPRHDTTCTCCCCCCTDTGYTPTTWLSYNTAGELLVHYAIQTLLPQQQLGCRCSASSNTNPERQLLNKKRPTPAVVGCCCCLCQHTTHTRA